MAKFQSATLDTLTQDADSSINAANGEADITSRTDKLVTAREDISAKFDKAGRREFWKGIAGVATAVVGAGATYLGVTTATSLIALLAGTTGLAIPLAIAGVAAVGVGVTFAAAASGNLGKLSKAWSKIESKFDTAIQNLVTAHPQETAKSSKLAAFLKRAFNPTASPEAAAQSAAPAVAVTTPKVSSAPNAGL